MDEIKPRFTTDPHARYEVPSEALTDAELRAIIADATHLKNRGVRYVILKLENGTVRSERLARAE